MNFSERAPSAVVLVSVFHYWPLSRQELPKKPSQNASGEKKYSGGGFSQISVKHQAYLVISRALGQVSWFLISIRGPVLLALLTFGLTRNQDKHLPQLEWPTQNDGVCHFRRPPAKQDEVLYLVGWTSFPTYDTRV